MSQHERMNDDRVDWESSYPMKDSLGRHKLHPDDAIHYGKNLWKQTWGTTWQEKKIIGSDGKERPLYTFDYNIPAILADLIQSDIIPMSEEVRQQLKRQSTLTMANLKKILAMDLMTTLKKQNNYNYILISGANGETLFDTRPKQQSGYHYQHIFHSYKREPIEDLEARDPFNKKFLKDENGYARYKKVHFLEVYDCSGGANNDHTSNDYWAHDNEKEEQAIAINEE